MILVILVNNLIIIINDESGDIDDSAESGDSEKSENFGDFC